MVADARMPSAPAFAVADTRRAPATQPMPVCTIGTSMSNRSQIGVRTITPRSRVRDFVFAQAVGVDHGPDPVQLVVGRQPRLLNVAVDHELESGCRDKFVDGYARMHRPESHAMALRCEVEHTQVRDDVPELMEASGSALERVGAVVADAAHDVDLGHEDARRVRGYPIRGLV